MYGLDRCRGWERFVEDSVACSAHGGPTGEVIVDNLGGACIVVGRKIAG